MEMQAVPQQKLLLGAECTTMLTGIRGGAKAVADDSDPNSSVPVTYD
jgi:hypothetical protein